MYKKLADFMNEGILSGKVALVTGASRGIGKETVLALAGAGAKVVLTARSEDEINDIANDIDDLNVRSQAVAGDISSYDDIRRIIKKALYYYGRIDILVNNAGVAYNQNFDKNSLDVINTTIDVNLRSLILMTKEVLPIMYQQGGGKIINVSSILGKATYPGFAVYSATKYGIQGFSDALSKEVEEKGIKVYTVCPAEVDTKMLRDCNPNGVSAPMLHPKDVADLILKLSLPDCKLKTGGSVDIRKEENGVSIKGL